MTAWAHPSLFLLVAAGVSIVLPRTGRRVAAGAGVLLALTAVALLPEQGELRLALLGHEVVLLRCDALGRLFALILALVTGIGTLYGLHRDGRGERASALGYAAGALGVVLAGDWLTLFAFWELMAVASAALIPYGGGRRARHAAVRYLLVHAAGGAVLLAGLLIGGLGAGTSVGPTPPGWGHALVLVGVCLNAAVPPLHAWLTDAYPEASISGSVFLSALTTKTAVYVMIRAFPGETVLVGFGVVMALYGVVYAVLENDTRRLLAYHIVSQVGYMVTGVGLGTPLSLDGAAAHAFCHILYKALLFMGAGAVIAATGRRKLTELGGLASRMPLVLGLYMVGAVSISGFPLFNGFVSKSMVVSAAGEAGHPAVELLLTLAAVGTFLHTGLKLPYYTFFGHDRHLPVRRLPWNTTAAMGLAAAACLALGVAPGWLYARLPFPVEYHPYTADHVVSALQLLLGTGLAFALLSRQLGGEPTVSLDTDWFYRRPLAAGVRWTVDALRSSGERSGRLAGRVVAVLSRFLLNPARLLDRLRLVPGPADPAADVSGAYDADLFRFPVGTTLLWVLVCFGLAALALG